jgi:hypothetical protein
MSIGRRAAGTAMVVCGLLVPAGAAQAANVVTTTAKFAGAKLSYSTKITTADGARPTNMSGASLPLPKGLEPNRTGFTTPCPIATIQANDINNCPAASKAGKGGGQINSSPVSETPLDTTGVVFFTGMKSGLPAYAIYYTVTQFPSAHSIALLSFKKISGRWNFRVSMPKLPIAPGLPDATPLIVTYDLAAKVLKGKCKAESLTSKLTFHDGTSATDALKSSC